VVVTVLLNIAMNKASQTEAEIEAEAQVTPPAGGSENDMVRVPGLLSRWSNVGLTCRWGNLVPLSLIVLGLLAAWEATSFRPRGEPFPLWTSIAIVIFSTYLLIRGSLATDGTKSGRIMDLGMVSQGAEGARRRIAILAFLFGLFLLVTLSFGLPHAALVFAGLTPLLLMRGKARWIAAVFALACVSVFVFFFADYLMGVIWPDPAFQTWLFD
jgi:hypothetical protein